MKRLILSILFVLLMVGYGWATTYYYRADGSAANKGAATSCSAAATSMDATVLNGETFSAGDIITNCGDDVGGITRVQLTPPSSGSDGSPITFNCADGKTCTYSGGELVTLSGFAQVTDGGADSDIIFDNFDDNDFTNVINWGGDPAGGVSQNKRAEFTIDATNPSPNLQGQTFIGKSEVWMEYDIYYNSITAANGNYIQGGGIRQESDYIKLLYLGARHTGGLDYFYYVYQDDTGQTQNDTSVQISTGQWYRILLHWKKSTGVGNDDGILQIWIDDTLALDVSDADTDTRSATGELVGNNYRSGMNTTFYIDNVKIGTSGSAIGAAASSNIWAASLADKTHVAEFDGSNYGYLQNGRYNMTEKYDWGYDENRSLVYVYATSDPDGYYTSMETSKRNFALLVDGKSYLEFNNLKFRMAEYYVAFLDNNQSNSTFTDCIFENGYLYGFVPAAADTITDITISGGEINRSGSSGLVATNKSSWLVSEVSFLRNGIISFSQDDTAVAALKWSAGISLYGANTNNMVIQKNEISYSGIRDDGYEPDSTNKGFGIWFDTITTTEGNENIARFNNSHHNVGSGLFDEKTHYSVWHNNVSYSNGEYGLRAGTDDANTCENNKYYNLTLYGNDVGIFTYNDAGTNDGAINNEFKNIISSGNTTREVTFKDGYHNDGTDGSGNVYSNNCFGAEASNFIEWGEGVYKSTYDAWETAYGGTTNSVEADPLFTNAAGGDFTLQEDSPCIDAGANLGDSYADGLDPASTWPDGVLTLNQNKYRKWDIGAYTGYRNKAWVPMRPIWWKQ